jgi:hypothetical protein
MSAVEGINRPDILFGGAITMQPARQRWHAGIGRRRKVGERGAIHGR